MPRDSGLYLDDILGAVEKILEYVRGMDYETFTRAIPWGNGITESEN